MWTKEEILNESIRNDAVALVQKFRERMYDIAMSELYVLLLSLRKKLNGRFGKQLR